MKRFENAKVGDKVYCRKNGNGIIEYITSCNITVGFNRISPTHDIAFLTYRDTYTYTLDGKLHKDDAEAILFYRSDTDNYLTERPKDPHPYQWIVDRLDKIFSENIMSAIAYHDISQLQWDIKNEIQKS